MKMIHQFELFDEYLKESPTGGRVGRVYGSLEPRDITVLEDCQR